MFAKTGRHVGRLIAGVALICCIGLASAPASAALIAYWDFNDSIGTSGPPNLVVDQGAGTLTHNFDDPTTNVTHFTGTNIGALPGVPPANRALALVAGAASVNNGREIIIAVNTTGQTGIVMTYATQRTTEGFNNNQIAYSTNGGGSFTDYQAAYDPATSFALRTVDFGSLLDNNANIQIRIRFDGATSSTGNNRLDNIHIFSGGIPTGACCTAGGTCTIELRDNCLNVINGNYLGDGTTCGVCPNYANIVINEIRIDQNADDVDEYFEIAGPPNTSLNGLSYIVIGDGAVADGSGVIESIVDLSGKTTGADGRFFCALDNDTLQVLPAGVTHAAADLIAEFQFENSDNVTHMLVSGFRGTAGQDLDVNEDCNLDAGLPWVQEVDGVSLVENPGPPPFPAGDECFYRIGVGPENVGVLTFVPGHIYRYDGSMSPVDGPGRPWVIGPFDAVQGTDTPGAVNAISTGACCTGACAVNTRDQCLALSGVWQGRNTTCTPNPCSGACCSPTNVCTISSRAACESGGGSYQGGGTTCTPTPCTCTDLATARTIPPPPVSPDPIQPVWNSGVRVCNAVVTSTTDLISSLNVKSFAIQDTSGADGRTAITVFGNNALLDQALAGVIPGSSINIQGVIIQFNGLLELGDGPTSTNPSQILPLTTFKNNGFVGVPAPRITTLAELQDANPVAETIESEYVQVNCIVFTQGDGVAVFNGPNNYTITDGTHTMLVRIATNALDWQGEPIPTTPCTIRGIVTQFDGSVPRDGGYQILVRGLGFADPDDLDAPASCGPTGGCCLPGPTCRTGLTAALCAGLGGVYRGDGTNCVSPNCPTTDGVVINEIRVDQPTAGDPDEYFELKGPPNVPLGSLSYIVIGDGSVPAGSGVVEEITSLSLKVMPAGGLFLAAESTYTLGGTVDLTTVLDFEDDDNVTHMLVENFTGANGQDLDTNDDGILDITPWTRVLSSIAIVKDSTNPPVGTERYYGPTVGPVPGGFSPGHVIRCPGALNNFIIGTFDIPANGGNDTPRAENDCTAACLTCPGDTDGSEVVNINDLDEFVSALLGITPNPCADVNVDTRTDGLDIRNMISLVLAPGGFGTSCLPPAQIDISRCDNAAPPNDCPNTANLWCLYTVDAGQAGLAPCVVVGPSGATTIAEGEQFCVECPAASGPCGTAGSKVQFRWVNHNGAGQDCVFLATLQSTSCTNCSGLNKRFQAPPIPSSIKVLDWNLLNYSGGRTSDYQTVLNAILPDVIITQEVSGTTGRDAFLAVLNGGGGPGGYNVATFTDGPDTDRALYYRTSRITFAGAGDYTTVATSPRITDRWKIGVVGYTNPDAAIYIYSMHLKAGSTGPDQSDRLAATQLIRAHANALPAGTNIIFAGDFNIQSSAELSYQELIGSQVDNDGRCFDPINSPGTWNINPTFAAIHTQSPHQDNPGAPGGASNGGMDDRFDFILMSSSLLDGLGTTYQAGTYRAYGNDGNHFNKDINDAPVIPEGATIANALHACSDHLPVLCQIQLPSNP